MRKTVLDAKGVEKALQSIAEQIAASSQDTTDLVLVGIHTGGVFVADRLKVLLKDLTGKDVQTGVIDINLYRDDRSRIGPKPVLGRTKLDFPIDNKRIVLGDDVLFTGRTIRAAMDALADFGRPARIERAVLADRGHRELPICTHFTGLTLETTRQERVNIYLSDVEIEDSVVVEQVG